MTHETIELPHRPGAALERIRTRSRKVPVIVFKKSPICPISDQAEEEFRSWLSGLAPTRAVAVAEVDVIAEKALARGLVAELDIQHESPQALVFRHGELVCHASHRELDEAWFDAACEDGD